jgi:hypothetical protein
MIANIAITSTIGATGSDLVRDIKLFATDVVLLAALQNRGCTEGRCK